MALLGVLNCMFSSPHRVVENIVTTIKLIA